MSVQDFRIDSLKGFDIHGKTVGVIGTGKIGLAFARIMLGFGARVLASDPIVSKEAVDIGVKYVSFGQLLKNSDIISLHCPLNTSTKYMMSAAEFNNMKRGVIIINSSRGAIIKSTDLIDALDHGQVGGACLDVYEFEKGLFFEDHRDKIIHDANFARLRNFTNVIFTCHQGFLTSEAITEIANTTIANLVCLESNSTCPNELTTSAQHKIQDIIANDR